MNKTGLVSITFRKKTPLEIVKLMNSAKLSFVEWGGDIHVPPKGGRAKEVKTISSDYGIGICSYGSYYRLGEGRDKFLLSLDEAEALGTDVMRIWGGSKDSAALDENERSMLLDELIAHQEIARGKNIKLALEYHPKTLTDDRESVRKLIKDLDRAGADNVILYWQPRWDWPVEERLTALSEITERLGHMHVFSWRHTQAGIERLPLSAGESMWKKVLSEYPEGYKLIEFVENDSDEALIKDAETLNGWMDA